MIGVKLQEGTISLDMEKKWEWKSEGDDEMVDLLASYANAYTASYTYNPADGEPGYRLAMLVATELQGEAIVPPQKNDEEEVIY